MEAATATRGQLFSHLIADMLRLVHEHSADADRQHSVVWSVTSYTISACQQQVKTNNKL